MYEMLQQFAAEWIKKHLPAVVLTETDALKMSIKSAEKLRGRGQIAKQVSGGLSEWSKPRKFTFEQG